MRAQLFVVAILSAMLALCASQLTGEEIVELMKRKYSEVDSYRAVITTGEGKIHVTFKKPDKIRIVHKGSTVVINGEKIWVCERGNATVARFEEEDVDVYYGKILELVDAKNAKIAGEEEVGGKSCYILDFHNTSNHDDLTVEKLWVVKGKWYPAKVVLKSKTCAYCPERVMVLNYESIEFNVEVDESHFLPCQS